jgi:uncharacterized protein YecT (DUF1311 family)
MRLYFQIFAIAFSAAAAISAMASPPGSQQSSETAAKQTPFVDPCANAVTPDDKKACWNEVARRAKFFLEPDPCETNAQQSDEERDNCKMDRAKKATSRVEDYYHSIQKALRADLAKGKAAEWNDAALLTELRDAQAAWTRYRDLQCEAETTPYGNGTVTISIKAGCQREKADARLKELQDTYGRYLRDK